MGWRNPPIPWSELERRLSGKPRPGPGGLSTEPPGDGNDSPAWTHRRMPYVAPDRPEYRAADPPYAELHAHSNFSFLDGASHPEEMAETAAELGLSALALTDHDGMYGVVRFSEAAKDLGLPTVFGAELSLGLSAPQNGMADPEGGHLLVLARGPEGYHRLCSAISAGQRDGEKGRPVFDLAELGERAGGHWAVLTGCRKGAVPAALAHHGADAARHALDELVGVFGRGNVVVELTDHGGPEDADRVDALVELARRAELDTVVTGNAHYATPSRGRLAAALAAVRARRSLEELDGWLPAAGSAYLRSGAEMADRFARYPDAVARSAELGAACAFNLNLVAPELPDFLSPEGASDNEHLWHLTMTGAAERYGPPAENRAAYEQLEYELHMIEQLNFPGYFLIVEDIVRFCREKGILCQGRGSAANSAVCFALGVTVVDPIKYRLLFERFLAPARKEPPDIDLDIASELREDVIQYVYQKYGRDNAAQVANIITYRPRSAVRDMAKALGYSAGQQDAWSKQIEGWGAEINSVDHDIPADVVELAGQLQGFPRHLGLHSGGMVLCNRPVTEVCPVEWARMPNRSVLQWDKDDCADTGLVKFDLLGLGMLSALQGMLGLIPRHYGVSIDLAQLPPDDPDTFAMLCAADSVGVFQVESRAQMATLPRLKPREFYDLVCEVALIRPGPIQGGSVHPYIRRRNGVELITYPHPLLEKSLERTKGIPLFQEQMMNMAIDAASFSPDQADQLRRAMDSRRAIQKMEKIKAALYRGMAGNGISGTVADDIYDKLAAFANFGFAESHAISFAYLVYSSAYLKRYYPAAFYAALLNAQPMGFYSPQSLITDARRHGLTVHGPDINISAALTTLEPGPAAATTLGRAGEIEPAIRLGLSCIRRVGKDPAQRVQDERTEHGPYADAADLVRRTALATPAIEALATAGAFDCFGMERRQALWSAGMVATERVDRLGLGIGSDPPSLPGMTPMEQTMADLWSTGISPTSYPTQFLRPRLDALGVIPADRLLRTAHGTRILIGGVVTHRQRPATASGITFMSLEDETGLINVVCSPGVWQRHRRVARESGALLIRGRLEKFDGVVNVVAEQIRKLPLTLPASSRDFR
jgi:error-prone DNA polymerase